MKQKSRMLFEAVKSVGLAFIGSRAAMERIWNVLKALKRKIKQTVDA